MTNRRFWSIVIVLLIAATVTGTASAKSLYLAAEHHQSLFEAWNIDPTGSVAKQATYNLVHSTDPSGIAIDDIPPPGECVSDPSVTCANDTDCGFGDTCDLKNPVIFITSEFSGGVEIVDPVDLQYLGVSSGPSNLAGIDVDDLDDIVFSLLRSSNRLYIYSWNPDTLTLTQDALVTLPGLGFGYGLAFDDFRDILWVSDTQNFMVRAYDLSVADWSDIVEIPALSFATSHAPIDVVVDRQRNIVYTTGGWVGSNLLTRYDVATGIETTGDLGGRGIGAAVEETTGYVYVTLVRSSLTVWDTSTTPFQLVQDTGPVGVPAGLAIGNIAYNPLKLAKNDVIVGEVYIGSTYSYEITYQNDNPFDVTNVTILDTLPPELDFVSATHDGLYDPVEHTVSWDIGTVLAGDPEQQIELVVRVNNNAVPGGTINNYVTISSDETGDTTVGDDEGSGNPDDEPGTPVGESIPVDFDIKPTSCPNPLNPESTGLLPAAILGTMEFDVHDIDPMTLVLEDLIEPLRTSYEDVTTPVASDADECECTEQGPDGYMDLTMKFRTADVVEALGSLERGAIIPLTISGRLVNGTPFFGVDCMVVVGRESNDD